MSFHRIAALLKMNDRAFAKRMKYMEEQFPELMSNDEVRKLCRIAYAFGSYDENMACYALMESLDGQYPETPLWAIRDRSDHDMPIEFLGFKEYTGKDNG